MDVKGNDVDIEALTLRVEQLQRERDELRKDIEQLCIQQAGPAYLSFATQMHFQRTANLEKDIETLQKRLAACLRDKYNLQEELTEAYRIKSQLADLHSAELVKNKEADKQVKFFQNCVAAAFAERDQSLMECEKAKGKEEIASTKLIVIEERMEELQSLYLNEKNLNQKLQAELNGLKNQMDPFAKVVMKFYEIREKEMESSLETSLEEKCICLLNDSYNNWMYSEDSETSTSKYIASLEDERDALKNAIDKLQSNLRMVMGLEIEHHFRRNVRSLEKRQKLYEDLISNKFRSLREFCANMRIEIMNILEEEESHIKANLNEFLDKLNRTQVKGESDILFIDEPQNDDMKYKDVHISSDISSRDVAQSSNILLGISDENMDMSKALAQALQEKVSSLLLLSQQEERHLHERNMNAALLKKIEDIQKNLSQVTNEKVKALMELAKLKQENRLLQEHINQNPTPVSCTLAGETIKRTGTHHEGKLKSILKRTYLNKWIGNVSDENNIHESGKTKEYSVDLARLKVENATLRESMANMERVISSIRRLHIILMKAQDDLKSNTSSIDSTYESLKSVITESNLIKTALGSVLPISWSGNSSDDAIIYESLCEPLDSADVARSEKSDPISTASMEMVELVLLAAETLTEMLADKKLVFD
ncbi:hypothetical protein LUZ60_006525 [Juncus effusus]|nr:hypothetical protein LUZ60_006525 [Juncus effusus]